MLLFNPTALAYHLRDGTLTEQEKFGYIVANIIVSLLTEAPSHLYSWSQPVSSVFSWLMLFLGISFFGLRACFATNSRGDNKHFIERWLCLSLPLQIWTHLIPYYVSWACYGLYARMASGPTGSFYFMTWFIAIANWVLFVLNFVLLNRFIAIAAGVNTSDTPPDSAPIASP